MEDTSRKRTKRTSSDDSEKIHKQSRRGRPRLNISDANSRDRRRTQIRLAQRAYRERKEDIITALTRRVSLLEGVVQDMGRTFSDYEDRAEQAPSFGAVQEELRQASGQIKALSAKGAPENLSPDEESGGTPETPKDILSARRAESPRQEQVFREPTTTMAQPLGYVTNGHLDSLPPTDAPTQGSAPQRLDDPNLSVATYDAFSAAPPSFTGVQHRRNHPGSSNAILSPHHVAPHSSDPRAETAHTSNQPGSQHVGLGYWAMPTQIPWMQPTPFFPEQSSFLPPTAPPTPSELPLPQSYSHQETSFSRRLIRTSLESSQRLLSDSNANPADIWRLGRYAMCYMQKHCMLAWFKGVWDRPIGENLERWGVPQYHAGGAGLHFPRAGIDAAGSKPPSGWDNKGKIGPMVNRPTEFPQAFAMNNDEVLNFANVKGDWYDANDVEQFLSTKGIRLDATSAIVEIADDQDSNNEAGEEDAAGEEIIMPTHTSSSQSQSTSHSASTAGPATPATTRPPAGLVEQLYSTAAVNTETAYSANRPTQQQQVNTAPVAYMTTIIGADTRLGQGGEGFGQAGEGMDPMLDFGPYSGLGHGSRKARKYMDVEVFLEDLLHQATCLGRTICFPRAAVETALLGATREVTAH